MFNRVLRQISLTSYFTVFGCLKSPLGSPKPFFWIILLRIFRVALLFICQGSVVAFQPLTFRSSVLFSQPQRWSSYHTLLCKSSTFFNFLFFFQVELPIRFFAVGFHYSIAHLPLSIPFFTFPLQEPYSKYSFLKRAKKRNLNHLRFFSVKL